MIFLQAGGGGGGVLISLKGDEAESTKYIILIAFWGSFPIIR